MGLASGCGTSSPPGDAAVGADDEPATAPMRASRPSLAGESVHEEAATLVIAARRVPDELDPLEGLDPLGARIVDDAVFEGLVGRDDGGWPWARPALADACLLVPEDDPRDAYCHLAPGRVFHDGTAVSPEDVLYSLDYWLDPRRGWLRDRYGLSSLKRVQLVDGPPSRAGEEPLPGFATADRDPGRWVRVSVSSGEPLLLERLAAMKVVPRSDHRGRRRSFAKAPIGTGPMKVVSLEADRIVLEPAAGLDPSKGEGSEAVEGYDPRVRRIILREMSDGAEVLTAMRRGEVHVATELSPAHVPGELSKAGMAARFEAWLVSPPRYDLLMYNLGSGVQSGPRLRAALDAGLPRARIATLLGGMPPLPVTAPVDLHDPSPIDLAAIAEVGRAASWGTAGLVEEVDGTADAAGAALLAAELDALGWTLERGVRRRETGTLRLVLMWNGASGDGRRVANAIKQGWREQGIVVPYATASWAYLRNLLKRGDFDIALARLSEASDADLYPYFHSRGELNITGIVDAELDAAIDAFRAARTRETRQDAERAVAERLAALRPVSVLHAPTAVTLVSRRVEGLRFIDDLPALTMEMRLMPHERWTLSRR